MNFPLNTAFIVSTFWYVIPSFSLKSRKFLILVLPWPSYRGVESCSVSTSMWDFCCFCCCWSLALVHGDLIECVGLFQSSCICWSLFYVHLYGQFWRRFHEVMRTRHILFFWGEMFCRYLLNPFGSWLLLVSLWLCLVFVLMTCPLVRVGYWSLPLLLCGFNVCFEL